MGQGGMFMNKKVFINLFATCLILFGCTTKNTPVETDACLDFVCKINDLKLPPNRAFTSPETYYYGSRAFGRDSYNYYSCDIICQYSEQISIFDITKPAKSSFAAEYSNGREEYPLYSSKSGSSDGEKLVFQRGYNDGLLIDGVPHDTTYFYAQSNTSLRYDLDFDFASFEMINEYITLCKSKESIQNGVFENETARYYIDIYPDNHLISCFATSKDTNLNNIRTNLYFSGEDDLESGDLFVAAISCDLELKSYFQTITFRSTWFECLTPIEEFEINPNASLYPQEKSDVFFGQEINAYVSREELINIFHPPF